MFGQKYMGPIGLVIYFENNIQNDQTFQNNNNKKKGY